MTGSPQTWEARIAPSPAMAAPLLPLAAEREFVPTGRLVAIACCVLFSGASSTLQELGQSA